MMDWEKASRLEWLEANGLGGYASSTACGANTRRYHGLLVPAANPPVGRCVLLSKLDERVTIGDQNFDLSSNQFPGAVHPRGFEYLDSFQRDVFPVFEYSFAGVRLQKTIAAIHGENTTVIVYDTSSEITLELRPFIAGRDYHSLMSENGAIRSEGSFQHWMFSLRPYDGIPPLYIAIRGAAFNAAPDWYRRFEYPIEQERGLDAHEDLFTPGTFAVTLKPGSPLAIIASTEDPKGRDGVALIEAERRRRENVVRKTPAEGRLGRALALAADQFIVRRGADRRTVIAGYHWFADWGRDTMIALPGLCLATRRFDDARKILLAFAESVSQGMIPNHFPDAGEQPQYNSVDASLWFFVAVKKYLDYSGDEPFVSKVLLPVLLDIAAWFERGTRHNIHEDSDGLLVAGSAGDQLTWMDVKIGDWVVTPRYGKAVEINALWFNALSILAEFDREFAARAERVRTRFKELFWNGKYLYDVVNGDERDASLRPNQIFAISLPYPLIDGPLAESVLKTVEEKLLTPRGLRTLAADDPRFIPIYIGGPFYRDRAYHQGTVWSWLLGPYITALVRVRGEAGVAEGKRILAEFEPHLEEACVGSISEIFDAMPPHAPRGCIAQAWSIAEILRAAIEDLSLVGTSQRATAALHV